jgi:hypothetical protein
MQNVEKKDFIREYILILNKHVERDLKIVIRK